LTSIYLDASILQSVRSSYYENGYKPLFKVGTIVRQRKIPKIWLYWKAHN